MQDVHTGSLCFKLVVTLKHQDLLNQAQFSGCCAYCQPAFYTLDLSDLNSAMYSCFGVFFICFGVFFIVPLPKLTSILRQPWKTKFPGKHR